MKKTFLEPDYYPAFACKCGDCVLTCCREWKISLSMSDYFRLLGLDCSPDLRRRIDVGMIMEERATEEKYARMNFRWDGKCPMLDGEGFCGLQRECGETVLPTVCRVFPRSPKTRFADEISCSCGCEKTIEMLAAKSEPLGFPEREEEILIPTLPREKEETCALFGRIRKKCLAIVQNRALPLAARLLLLGRGLKESGMFEHRCEETVSRFEAFDPMKETLPEAKADHARFLAFCEKTLDLFGENSPNIRYCREVFAKNLAGGLPAYEKALALLKEKQPDHEAFFERVLTNHMFYVDFPMSDLFESPFDETLALCAAYLLLRYAAVGSLTEAGEYRSDVIAALYRFIDGSDFTRSGAESIYLSDGEFESVLYSLLSE